MFAPECIAFLRTTLAVFFAATLARAVGAETRDPPSPETASATFLAPFFATVFPPFSATFLPVGVAGRARRAALLRR
jgi:hypothetical protein